MLISSRQGGISLIEVLVFIVVVSIALGALLNTMSKSTSNTADPAVRIKALEKAQALMDEVLVRKFDENTPTGGTPACDSAVGVACAGIISDSDFDDVGDYNAFNDLSDPLFPVSVTVIDAGSELGLTNSQARRITIVVSAPNVQAITLSSYKVNF